MALIKCSECGKMISDKAQKCPQCGCPVTVEEVKLFCPECGSNVSEDKNFCPNCGCPSSLFTTSQVGLNHEHSSNYREPLLIQEKQEKTDVFAIIAFASALVSLIVLPILFVPISIISNCVSYYRIKENPNLTGWGLKIAAAIICVISLVWYFHMLNNY